MELNGLMANYQSSPEIIAAYAYAEKQTGVPCEVLAGIHSVEGKGNATQGLQEGQAISVSELPASALRAAQMLQDAANANVTAGFTSDSNLSNYQTLVAALSTYNAGGNLQCWVGPNRCGEAVPIPPYQFSGGCPPKYPAEDSLYALSLLDPRHAAMYLRYCADDGPDANDCGELCPTPVLWNRPGAITVAVWFYENISTQP